MNLELMYELVVSGLSDLATAAKLEIPLVTFEKLVTTDPETKEVYQKAKRYYYDNKVKDDTGLEITRSRLLKMALDKAQDDKASVKDIQILWNLAFPEDDVDKINAQTRRIQVENTQHQADQVGDDMIKLLQNTINGIQS